MKNLLVISIILFSFKSLLGQADFEAKDRDRISKNNVKIQTQWAYDYEKGVPSAKGYVSAKTTFDKNGNAIEVVNYKADGTISSVLTYTYDGNNNKTSYSRFRGNKDQLTYNQKLIYDTHGNKVGETGFDGVSNFNNTFTYDAAGNLSTIVYTTDKMVTEKRVFSYKGTTTEMKILNANNDIISREITTHDNKNNKLEEMKYIQENLTQKSNYQYNPKGKKVEETKENFGKLVYHRIYKYDSMDNLLQIIEENSDGKSFVSYQYQYDTKGNPISERWTKDSTSEYSSKIHKYLPNDLLSESDCYLASYKFSVLYKYTYQYF